MAMRPHIICHMGTSIDGRLHPSRFTVPASGIPVAVLRAHYERVHEQFDADGWIVGRKTMSEMSKGATRAIKDVCLGLPSPDRLALGFAHWPAAQFACAVH